MFDEDFSVYLSTNEFASDATLNGVAVRGIFDNAYVATEPGMGMSSTQPLFALPTADVPANPVGKSLIVNGATYAIASHEPDGTGMSTLILERTA
jgi:hypothetical protein